MQDYYAKVTITDLTKLKRQLPNETADSSTHLPRNLGMKPLVNN
jgi:hypothetical protein